ncbi:EAL domain-containing protein [Sphingomonas sp. LR59]|uniref:EAL domain-containing protein n=1 Tax=Sphingomonas sp. LR59 TaxID=3050232 RepID=UPI00301F3DCC
MALRNRIHVLGVKTVLDGFSTGSSSLGYLQHCPFDKVKIDKTFVNDIMDNGVAFAIVDAVLLRNESVNMRLLHGALRRLISSNGNASWAAPRSKAI